MGVRTSRLRLLTIGIVVLTVGLIGLLLLVTPSKADETGSAQETAVSNPDDLPFCPDDVGIQPGPAVSTPVPNPSTGTRCQLRTTVYEGDDSGVSKMPLLVTPSQADETSPETKVSDPDDLPFCPDDVSIQFDLAHSTPTPMPSVSTNTYCQVTAQPSCPNAFVGHPG